MNVPVRRLCTNDGCGQEMFAHAGFWLCAACDLVVQPDAE